MKFSKNNASKIFASALAVGNALTGTPVLAETAAPVPAAAADTAAVPLPDTRKSTDAQLLDWAKGLNEHQRKVLGIECGTNIADIRKALTGGGHHRPKPDQIQILTAKLNGMERILKALLEAQNSAPPVTQTVVQNYQPVQIQLGLRPIPFDPSKPIGVPMGEPITPFTQADYDFVKQGGCHLTLGSVVNADCPVYKIEKDTTIVGVMGLQNDGTAVFLETQQAIINVQQSGWMDHGQGWGGLALQGLGLISSTSLGIEALSIARAGLHAQQNLDVSISDGIKGGKISSLFGSFGGCGNMTIVGDTSSSGTGAQVNGGASAICNFQTSLVNTAEGMNNTSSPQNPTTSLTAIYSGLNPG